MPSTFVQRLERRPRDELAQRAAKGDTSAFVRIYRRYCDEVHGRLYHLVGDADVADDLTQETFARAVIGIRRFRGDASIRHWLHRLVLNVAREHWRSAKSRRRLEDSIQSVDAWRPSEDLEARQVDVARTKALYAALESLPGNLREAFILRDLVGLSLAEAAAQSGISANNIAVRSYRARRRIRHLLIAKGWVGET